MTASGEVAFIIDAPDKVSAKQAQARLDVSRHACALFWERGVSGTSGDDIAAAAGLSTRTIWRYFRSKEAARNRFSPSPCTGSSAYSTGGRPNCR